MFYCATLLILVAAAFGGGLHNELVFDERMFVERDERVHDLDIDRIFLEALWSEGENDERVHQYYRPLQLLPLAVSYQFFGEAGWPSHVLSLLVHLANCLLALSLFRVLLLPGYVDGDARLLPFMLVCLWAVHPGLSEAVFWASDIAGLGATFCILATLRLHLAAGRDRWRGQVGAALLLLIGLWFKESGILTLPLLVLYDLVAAPDRGRGRLWRLRWRYVAFLPPIAIYAAMRLHALGGALPGMASVPLSAGEHILNGIALLTDFASTFVWPFDPNMFHDFEPIRSLASPRLWIGAAIAISAAGAVAATAGRLPVAAFAALWILVCAAPHLLVRWPQLNVFAERYLYLPSVGVFLLLGTGLARVSWKRPRPRRLAVAAWAAVLATFIITDHRRAPDWRDDVTLYEKTLRQSERAELIRTNLAIRYLELGRHDEGIDLMHGVLTVNPDWPHSRYNLGLLYMAKGETSRAIGAFEAARRRDPYHDGALLNLGYLYDRSGRRTLAVQRYLALVQRDPENSAGWYNLALIASEQGQPANARLAVARVLAVAPHDAAAAALAKRIERTERMPAPARKTRRACQRAKRKFDEGRIREAILELRAAAWFDEASPLPHHFLVNIYYLSGQLAEAREHARAALGRAPDNPLYRNNVTRLGRAAMADDVRSEGKE